MSAEVKFYCDFCSGVIIAGTANKESQGYYLKKDHITKQAIWTMVLNKYDNIRGPHICSQCLAAALDSEDVKL